MSQSEGGSLILQSLTILSFQRSFAHMTACVTFQGGYFWEYSLKSLNASYCVHFIKSSVLSVQRERVSIELTGLLQWPNLKILRYLHLTIRIAGIHSGLTIRSQIS